MPATRIVPLDQARDPDRFGAKAANLARLAGAGIETAPGLVLGGEVLRGQLRRLGLEARVDALFASLAADSAQDLAAEAAALRASLLEADLEPALRAELDAALVPGMRYAVRSSAPGEDGREASFAGQFDTVLDCASSDAVVGAIVRVWASLLGERALRYARHRRARPRGMAVIVQRQVEAAVSGVLFTRDPLAPDTDGMLVEYCAGLGESLVSGQVEPGRFRIARRDGALAPERAPEAALAPDPARPETGAALLATGLRLETLFAAPQDVEWSLDASGRLFILQARPITALAGRAVVWTNANIAENFPDPVCPLLRSFVARGYAAYFRGLGRAFGISARRMAAMAEPLDQLVDCHGGRLYYNLSHIHAVLHLAPGGPWLARFFNQFTGAEGYPAPPPPRLWLVARIAETVWVALRVAWRYLHVERGLRRFEARVDTYAEASAPDGLRRKSPRELGRLLRRFLAIRLEHWTDAALADTAAMVSYGVLKALLRGRAEVDANDLLKGLPGLVSAVPVERLWDLSRDARRDPALAALFRDQPAEVVLARLNAGDFAAFHAALARYFDTWGFRYSGELMLSRPTPREDPLPALRLLKSYMALVGAGPADISRRQAEARVEATRALRARLRGLPALVFPLALRAAQGAIRLRERARMKQALLYTRLRHVALALGDRLVAVDALAEREDVLFLTMEEAIAFAKGAAWPEARARVAERRRELASCATWSPPDSFALPAGQYWRADMPARQAGSGDAADALAGTGACGGRVCGNAAVVLDVAGIDRIRPDQILVTRQTDPGWAAVFFMIKGLVVERGGLLSHGAIIAREYGIPAVVGVRDATRLIADGAAVCVDGDRGRVEHVRD